MTGPAVLTADETTQFKDRLHRYATITRREAIDQIPKGEPYHLYDMVHEQLAAGGKGVRAALCLAACNAFGGSTDAALPAAVSLELLHAAFLVHDDIQDDSQTRRGRPTLHTKYDKPRALSAGDALLSLSLGPLLHGTGRGSVISRAVLNEFDHLMRQTIEGQAVDVAWSVEPPSELSAEDYFDMVRKKTSWYTTIHPIRIGALIGSYSNVDPDRFNLFGEHLGAMFQVRNDLEGLGHDLREGKQTLMLIHLRQVAASDEHVRSLLATPREERDQEYVDRVRTLMETHNSIQHAEARVQAHALAAQLEFDRAFDRVPESEDRRFLANMASYLSGRLIEDRSSSGRVIENRWLGPAY